ncbi:MAG: hypothetical protein AB1564_10070 [Chloroflexota bacterium]
MPIFAGSSLAIISLVISVIATVISIMGIRYMRKQYDIDRQQYELERMRFADQVTRQGPLLEIIRGRLEYLATPAASPELSKPAIIRGRLKGVHKKTLFGTEMRTRLMQPYEDMEVNVLGMNLLLDITVSNVGEVPIWIDNIIIRIKASPQVKEFWLKFFPRDQISANLYEFRYDLTYNLYTSSEWRQIGLFGILFRPWREYVAKGEDFFRKLFSEVELIDLETSKGFLLNGQVQIQPKLKKIWRINMQFTHSVASFFMRAQAKPQSVDVIIMWEGKTVEKSSDLFHCYAVTSTGPRFGVSSAQIVER